MHNKDFNPKWPWTKYPRDHFCTYRQVYKIRHWWSSLGTCMKMKLMRRKVRALSVDSPITPGLRPSCPTCLAPSLLAF